MVLSRHSDCRRDQSHAGPAPGATLQAGSYYAVVSNGAGTVTSETFQLGVAPAPSGPGTVDATFHAVLAWEGPMWTRARGLSFGQTTGWRCVDRRFLQ